MPDLTQYYKGLLPAKYSSLLDIGVAHIFRNRDGYWYCYDKGCFKLFKKFESLAVRLVEVLVGKCLTARQISMLLNIPYSYVRQYIYYYYKAGLLKRESICYSLNNDHPQIQLFYEIILSVNSLLSKITQDSSKILKEEPIHKNVNGNKRVETISIDDVLRKAERLANDLSEQERLIIIKLVEWRNLRKKWYVCVSDPSELSELLNINIDTESLKRLEKLGIIFRYFDKRHKQHCIRISKGLVE